VLWLINSVTIYNVNALSLRGEAEAIRPEGSLRGTKVPKQSHWDCFTPSGFATRIATLLPVARNDI